MLIGNNCKERMVNLAACLQRCFVIDVFICVSPESSFVGLDSGGSQQAWGVRVAVQHGGLLH